MAFTIFAIGAVLNLHNIYHTGKHEQIQFSCSVPFGKRSETWAKYDVCLDCSGRTRRRNLNMP